MTVAKGDRVTCDATAFVKGAGKALVLRAYFNDAANDDLDAYTVAGASAPYKLGNDAATTGAVAGFGTSSNYLIGFHKIEIKNATAIDLSLPSQTTINATPKSYQTTGSMSVGSNLLVVASNPGFQVNDYIIFEIGGRPGGHTRHGRRWRCLA